MTGIVDVADEILRLAKQRGRPLTPLQLVKLAYIAQGWSLAVRNRSLFNERIEAWKYGPVIPDLYHATKKYGRDPIPFDLIEDNRRSVDDETSRFLDDVVEKYSHLSGWALSSLTHRTGSPWQKVFEDGVFGIERPEGLIRDHYRGLHDEYRSRTTA